MIDTEQLEIIRPGNISAAAIGIMEDPELSPALRIVAEYLNPQPSIALQSSTTAPELDAVLGALGGQREATLGAALYLAATGDFDPEKAEQGIQEASEGRYKSVAEGLRAIAALAQFVSADEVQIDGALAIDLGAVQQQERTGRLKAMQIALDSAGQDYQKQLVDQRFWEMVEGLELDDRGRLSSTDDFEAVFQGLKDDLDIDEFYFILSFAPDQQTAFESIDNFDRLSEWGKQIRKANWLIQNETDQEAAFESIDSLDQLSEWVKQNHKANWLIQNETDQEAAFESIDSFDQLDEWDKQNHKADWLIQNETEQEAAFESIDGFDQLSEWDKQVLKADWLIQNETDQEAAFESIDSLDQLDESGKQNRKNQWRAVQHEKYSKNNQIARIGRSANIQKRKQLLAEILKATRTKSENPRI